VLGWLKRWSRRRWYREVYLRSRHWRAVRQWALDRAGHRCEVDGCGARRRLVVHHLTYRNLGAELPGDLQVLCRRHHEAVR
jgi:hypothetical protein